MDRQTDRHTYRQTHEQTNWQADKQTNKQTDIQNPVSVKRNPRCFQSLSQRWLVDTTQTNGFIEGLFFCKKIKPANFYFFPQLKLKWSLFPFDDVVLKEPGCIESKPAWGRRVDVVWFLECYLVICKISSLLINNNVAAIDVFVSKSYGNGSCKPIKRKLKVFAFCLFDCATATVFHFYISRFLISIFFSLV